MRIIFCDDDRLYAESAMSAVKNAYPYWEIGYASSSSQLMEKADENTDAVFMDIELGGESGIGAAEKVCEKYSGLKIIFVTSYGRKYSEAVFLANSKIVPFGFVDKGGSDIGAVLDKLAQSEKERDSSEKDLFVKCGEDYRRISLDSVLYIELNGRTTLFHTAEGCCEACEESGSVVENLPCGFIPCRKGYIVNIFKTDRIEKGGVRLSDGTLLPLSRSNAREIKDAFLIYGSMSDD